MRVLIATPQAREAQLVARILGGIGHDVACAESPEALAAELERCYPDVAIVGINASPWVAPFQARGGPHIYLISLQSSLDATPIQNAWDAGFDDVMRRGACAEEIAGRVAAIDRIKAWLPTMADDCAGGKDFDPTTSPSVLGLGATLSDEFGAMTGAALACSQATELPKLAHCAEVPLSLTSDGIEIMLGVGVVEGNSDVVGTLLFGEPVGRDVMADAMREFANTAGGALKRTALDHDKAYSLGLPVDSLFPSPPPGSPIWRLQGDGLDLVAWVAVTDDRPRRLTASMLAEGMVLTQPVLNGAGVLLVPAGSVLTQSTVDRLLEMAGPSALVEVARAA